MDQSWYGDEFDAFLAMQRTRIENTLRHETESERLNVSQTCSTGTGHHTPTLAATVGRSGYNLGFRHAR